MADLRFLNNPCKECGHWEPVKVTVTQEDIDRFADDDLPRALETALERDAGLPDPQVIPGRVIGTHYNFGLPSKVTTWFYRWQKNKPVEPISFMFNRR